MARQLSSPLGQPSHQFATTYPDTFSNKPGRHKKISMLQFIDFRVLHVPHSREYAALTVDSHRDHATRWLVHPRSYRSWQPPSLKCKGLSIRRQRWLVHPSLLAALLPFSSSRTQTPGIRPDSGPQLHTRLHTPRMKSYSPLHSPLSPTLVKLVPRRVIGNGVEATGLTSPGSRPYSPLSIRASGVRRSGTDGIACRSVRSTLWSVAYSDNTTRTV